LGIARRYLAYGDDVVTPQVRLAGEPSQTQSVLVGGLKTLPVTFEAA